MFKGSIGGQIGDYFYIAAKTAVSKNDQRTFLHGAVGIRHDGAMVRSMNGPSMLPMRMAHAEYRVARKMDVGGVIYVVRIGIGTGKFAISKPCHNCQHFMKSRGINKVYYSINEDEYGVVHLQ